MIAFTMTRAEQRFQQGFLEIVKWTRHLCPHQPIRLYGDPRETRDLESLEDVEILPRPPLPPPAQEDFPEVLDDPPQEPPPIFSLWGPYAVDEPEMGEFEELAFSTRMQYRPPGGEGTGELPLILIHGEPQPTEPTVATNIPESKNRFYTGFVTKIPEENATIWPVHTRGAEVTANIVKNILCGTSIHPAAFLQPIIAMIEPTRRCNLACPLCPVGRHQAYKAHDMPLESFERIIDELRPFLIHLTLHNYGEPFLHRDIYQMIGYAKKAGIPDVNVSTNGHVLNPDRVIASGLDEIMISLDGITEETYARYRQGGTLATVTRNIRDLCKAKQKIRAQKPLVELQFIIMRHNQNEMNGFRALAAELGADRIRFKTLNLHMSGAEVNEEDVNLLPTDTLYTRYEDRGGQTLKRHLEENRCKWPWERMVVNSDGRVVPCCNDFNGQYAMGNALHQSLRDIWFGERYNQFRRKIIHRWRHIPLCAHCPVPNRADLSFERLEITRGLSSIAAQ
jgi:radical SAM protein with 4Fe4S-binding SPASM domain